jgi:hypothetical protein
MLAVYVAGWPSASEQVATSSALASFWAKMYASGPNSAMSSFPLRMASISAV